MLAWFCVGFLSWCHYFFAFPSHCSPCCYNQNGRVQQIPHLSINIRKQVRLDSHKVDGPSKAKTRSVTRNHLGTLSLCDPKTIPNWLTPYENKGKTGSTPSQLPLRAASRPKNAKLGAYMMMSRTSSHRKAG